MPPPLLFDLDDCDLTRVVLTREQIYDVLPHRYEFMLLDGITLIDTATNRMIAYADITEDAWWARGHVPGNPVLPGVVMIEMAAQAASYCTQEVLGYRGFWAFAALDACKFRGVVAPNCRLYLLGQSVDIRPRRSTCAFQAVVNGKLVFEARITGLPLEIDTSTIDE
ncbi:MAG: beta-hydroxyacyl-ACP dehydratase [Phycisphaerae bacterium]|nr:beta-hydroxyacyl-ACP dehydratase [Phycisphaerae bacterium]